MINWRIFIFCIPGTNGLIVGNRRTIWQQTAGKFTVGALTVLFFSINTGQSIALAFHCAGKENMHSLSLSLLSIDPIIQSSCSSTHRQFCLKFTFH